jgi:hypothetical protein
LHLLGLQNLSCLRFALLESAAAGVDIERGEEPLTDAIAEGVGATEHACFSVRGLLEKVQ